MSQTGTPTEFLQLGITEPDDTLNVLVDLNGQWQKIDTGVKNVDTKANTNASGISALNTAVQDNTENITNILETNVNQQTSIDTLQSKVATLEEDDTSYGTRITAVEAGVQENSELINDLEVDLSGVKTSVGTVPSGSTLQGQVDGLDTRVTTLETEVGTVPSGETVQGQITTLNGQVNSGNIPFRFSVDGGGNYGYLKADDSFVPFSSGSPTSLAGHNIIDINYGSTSVEPCQSSFILYRTTDATSPNYKKVLYIPTLSLIDVSTLNPSVSDGSLYNAVGELLFVSPNYYYYDRDTNNLVQLQNAVGVCSGKNSITYYTKPNNNVYSLHYVDLVDSTNNFDRTLTLPQDKLQSTTTGKLGMVFHPYTPGDVNHYHFEYISNNGYVTAGTLDNSSEPYYSLQNLTNPILRFYSSYTYCQPNKLYISGNGLSMNSDDMYCLYTSKYTRVGNYCIELY